MWLGDRFRYREKLIAWHDSIERVLGVKENDSAFVGSENWLFFKGDNSEALYANMAHLKVEEFEGIKKSLSARKDWLSERGINYVVVVPPDKSSIYGEYYRKDMNRKPGKDRVQELDEFLRKENARQQIHYLLSEIMGHKNDGELIYWKTDTHWNELGAYWGYLAMMEDIARMMPQVSALPVESMDFNPYETSEGDLLRMLSIRDSAKYCATYQRPVPRNGWHFFYKKGPEIKPGGWDFDYIRAEGKQGIHTINPDKPYKLMVFMDSFSLFCIPYFSETFGEVKYVWDYNMMSVANKKKIIEFKPDIVLQESVSRLIVPSLLDVAN